MLRTGLRRMPNRPPCRPRRIAARNRRRRRKAGTADPTRAPVPRRRCPCGSVASDRFSQSRSFLPTLLDEAPTGRRGRKRVRIGKRCVIIPDGGCPVNVHGVRHQHHVSARGVRAAESQRAISKIQSSVECAGSAPDDLVVTAVIDRTVIEEQHPHLRPGCRRLENNGALSRKGDRSVRCVEWTTPGIPGSAGGVIERHADTSDIGCGIDGQTPSRQNICAGTQRNGAAATERSKTQSAAIDSRLDGVIWRRIVLVKKPNSCSGSSGPMPLGRRPARADH